MIKIEMIFYSSEGWESEGPDRAGRWWCGFMLWFQLEGWGDRTKYCWKMKRSQWARLDFMRRKRDTVRRRGDVDRRKGGTGEGKRSRRHQLYWRESYWAEKWKKFTWSIQLLQMDGENLKQQWVNLIYFENICKCDLVLFVSSHRIQCWK
jgi:hypothetical protein